MQLFFGLEILDIFWCDVSHAHMNISKRTGVKERPVSLVQREAKEESAVEEQSKNTPYWDS